MSELRLNILDGNWIVLAPERGKKLESFKVDRGTDIRDLPEYDENCPFCAGNAMLDYELQDGARVIEESADYVVLSPYAPSAPYETWVVPKRHFACYSEVQDSDISHISAGVRTVLNAYVNKLNNPDFNYYLHSSPFPMAKVPFYHFFVRIVPRLWNNGGFETGTGMSVISTMPEDAAAFLRQDSKTYGFNT